MKTELIDISETQKILTIEIPSEVVDAEINRVAKSYSRQARIPGFRPGKVPATLVKQRFRDQILHDVMHELIPRAVDEALSERGIEPIDTPAIKDVALREGQPLRFTADIETVPPFDPGDLSTIEVRRPSTIVTDEAVNRALERLRERAARYEPVEGRSLAEGDTVVVDIERRRAGEQAERHEGVTIELGSPANPPGFDAQLVGLSVGDRKTFTIHFSADYPVRQLADTDVTYTVDVREVRRKVLPELDDEFAKDLGEFDSLTALRDRVRRELEEEAEQRAARRIRADVLKQLAARVPFAVPPSLVEREIDRRLEEFVHQLVAEHVDPRQAGIDWAEFREAQREPARAAVAGALVLDEVARRERITVAAADVDKEIERLAARSGRTPAAVRAQLEKEGGVARLAAGLRRERAVDLAVSRAKVISE